MQFALLIYHSPEEFAMRKNDYNDPHLAAWRAYYKALVEANVYVGGDALEVTETATTVRLREGKRRVQDGPYADTKEQLAGFIVLELPSTATAWALFGQGAFVNLGRLPKTDVKDNPHLAVRHTSKAGNYWTSPAVQRLAVRLTVGTFRVTVVLFSAECCANLCLRVFIVRPQCVYGAGMPAHD